MTPVSSSRSWDHEVLAVAHHLVGEDLAVMAGGVRGHFDTVQTPPDEPGDALVSAPQDLHGVTVLDGIGDGVRVLAADLGEGLVRLGAIAVDAEDVTRLLVDRVAGGAHVAHHGMPVLHGHAGVACRESYRGGHGDDLGVVPEAGAARLLGVHGVLDAEALEEPFGGGLRAGILRRDQTAAEQQHAALDARYIGSLGGSFAHGHPHGRWQPEYSACKCLLLQITDAYSLPNGDKETLPEPPARGGARRFRVWRRTSERQYTGPRRDDMSATVESCEEPWSNR